MSRALARRRICVKDLRKAFECYHKIVDRKIYEHDSEEEKNEILSARCSFRRLKKILFEQKDEIRMTVAAKGQKSVCGFSFTSYGDCQFTIDWGDGQVEAINNEKGEEIQAEPDMSEIEITGHERIPSVLFLQ